MAIFPVYKPKGFTSYDVVALIKKEVGQEKVGHAGTLDPLASGVLVVAVGREDTKKLREIVAKEKEYIATIKLGEESETDDEEGRKNKIEITEPPDLSLIKRIVPKFEGRIFQKPPIYSAIKIKGKAAYKLARKGERPELKARPVEIKKIEILEYKWPFLSLKVITGPGVYIRALARDIGKELETGGYLSSLERTRVGDFTKDKAISITEIPKFLKK